MCDVGIVPYDRERTERGYTRDGSQGYIYHTIAYNTIPG
jgi:hypothetical protein